MKGTAIQIARHSSRSSRRSRIGLAWMSLVVAALVSVGSPGVPASAGVAAATEQPQATCAPNGQCFADVPASSPFYDFANRLYEQDIITGYACGGPGEPCDANNRPYYRPGDQVTRQQMSKFVDNARHLPGILIETSTEVAPLYSHSDALNGIGLWGVANNGEDATGVYGESSNGVGVRGVGSAGPGTGSIGVLGSSSSDAGVYGVSTNTNDHGVFGMANNGANAAGVFGQSTSGRGVYGITTALDADGVYGVSSNGINAVGVRGLSNSNTGVMGSSSANNGEGVVGTSAGVGGDGVYGTSYGADGNGVSGVANNGTNAVGVNGYSSSGTGVSGASGAANGIGVYGEANTGGNAQGVYGFSSSAFGVRGITTAVNGRSIYGHTSAATATGIFGFSNSYVGTYGSSTSSIGVMGFSTTGDGVHGVSSNGGDGIYGFAGGGGRAGYFSGNVVVTGACCAAAEGTFKIDHPLDPENKYLYHAAVESSELKNIYDGVATLDNNGEANVQLPEWFEALNSDYRYQFAPIGAPMPDLYVAKEIESNHFKIAGGKAGMKVSWQVTGIRQDAYAQAHPVQVEEAKSGEEQGKYLHPEESGQPASKGIDYEKTQVEQQR